ncbi:MAG: hypothetical protein QM679_05840 [Patulibacter sp.]
MPTPGSLLRLHEGVPVNVRPRVQLRLAFAGNVVPYLRPTVELKHR